MEDCVVIGDTQERKWYDTKCFYWYRYICQKPTLKPIEKTPLKVFSDNALLADGVYDLDCSYNGEDNASCK